MSVDFRVTLDNAGEIVGEMKKRVDLALQVIGADAVTTAQKDCPVDTGALRNSLAWATSKDSKGNKMPGEGEPSTPNGTPDDSHVYIGSNLEYAETVEYKDSVHRVGRAHFLRDAATTHTDHYKEILRAALDS